MDSFGYRFSASWAVAIAIVMATVGFFRIYRYRLSFKSLHGNLKAPPFSMWFGTIPGMAAMYETSPQDVHPMTTLTLMSRKHDLGDIFYLDNWPAASHVQMVLNSPDLAAQVTQQHSLPKYVLYGHFMAHLTGSKSMLFADGAAWKHARGLFNPGFALSHLMTLVPGIVDDTTIFQEKFGELADSKEVKPIEELLARLTIDIMGHIILDHDLNAQTTENKLVSAFRSQMAWTPNAMAPAFLKCINPFMLYAHWYYSRIMHNYLLKVIQHRIAVRKEEIDISKKESNRRPAIELAIDEYFLTSNGKVGKDFEQLAIDQMRTFLFAGHDTSSSTMCYVYNLLDDHPEALRRVRQEHDDMFGPSKNAAEAIKAKPQLLNELPYTTAVIKEVLRLFPPASTVRQGLPEISVVRDGITYPTDGYMVWINLHTIQRRADLFPDPDAFIPERFLLGEDMWPPQKEIRKDSFRPFEKGPRACIGQELAMLEMKIIMVMTCRDFDVKIDYTEWERKMGREKPGDDLGGKRTMFGHRAYPQMKAAAKPADGLPARVFRRSNTIRAA